MKKAANKAGLQFQAGYNDGHFHLEHDSQEAKNEYQNDDSIDESFVPTDDYLNKESDKMEKLSSQIFEINGTLDRLTKRYDRKRKAGKDVGNLGVRIQFYQLLKEGKERRWIELDRE